MIDGSIQRWQVQMGSGQGAICAICQTRKKAVPGDILFYLGRQASSEALQMKPFLPAGVVQEEHCLEERGSSTPPDIVQPQHISHHQMDRHIRVLEHLKGSLQGALHQHVENGSPFLQGRLVIVEEGMRYSSLPASLVIAFHL